MPAAVSEPPIAPPPPPWCATSAAVAARQVGQARGEGAHAALLARAEAERSRPFRAAFSASAGDRHRNPWGLLVKSVRESRLRAAELENAAAYLDAFSAEYASAPIPPEEPSIDAPAAALDALWHMATRTTDPRAPAGTFPTWAPHLALADVLGRVRNRADELAARVADLGSKLAQLDHQLGRGGADIADYMPMRRLLGQSRRLAAEGRGSILAALERFKAALAAHAAAALDWPAGSPSVAVGEALGLQADDPSGTPEALYLDRRIADVDAQLRQMGVDPKAKTAPGLAGSKMLEERAELVRERSATAKALHDRRKDAAASMLALASTGEVEPWGELLALAGAYPAAFPPAFAPALLDAARLALLDADPVVLADALEGK